MDEKYIQIQWTCASLDEARHIARMLVEKKWVACAQIIPWVESVFMWNNQLDTVQESKVIFKTRASLFEQVKNLILQHAQYEIPEILALPITEGHQEYLEWVAENTQEAPPQI